jgi:signal transduction histidine kinase
VIATTWSRLEKGALASGLSLQLDLQGDLVVASDPGKLGIVIDNLLGNAVSRSLPSTVIRCVGTRTKSRFLLDITNAATPMTEEERSHLTEPFWRRNEARNGTEHAGLGLALVKVLAKLLQIDVRFAQDRHGRFRVRLQGQHLVNGHATPSRAAPPDPKPIPR